MPDNQRGRLDGAIDRAVRGMMQREPSPGLRHRVGAKISAPMFARRWLIPALAAAGGVCVTALLAMVLSRGSATTVTPNSQTATATTIAPVATVSPTGPATLPHQPAPIGNVVAAPVRRLPSRPVFDTAPGRVTAANIGSGSLSREIRSARDDAPLERDAPAFTPITIAPIRVEPITIPPVGISALPNRR